METVTKFACVKTGHTKVCLTSGNDIENPTGDRCQSLNSLGSVFYGLSLNQGRVYDLAFPKEGLNPVKSPTMAFKDLLPVGEPKLNYTVTSFDDNGRVNESISLLGGRGYRLAFPDPLPTVYLFSDNG